MRPPAIRRRPPMAISRISALPLVLAPVLALLGCEAAPVDGSADMSDELRPKLGLMTSLPLYWPLGVDMAALASGDAEVPWQRLALEREYELVPLDTLSPIAGLTEDAPEADPLAGLDHLAVVQPRGLSPADNVALDDWVRAGGELLLVLDPMLSAEYSLPIGDPRLPTIAVLIPPVVERWGLKIGFDDENTHGVEAVGYKGGDGKGRIVLRSMAGEVTVASGGRPDCDFMAEQMIAQCRVGEGRVTLVADAASFEFSLDQFEEDVADRSPMIDLMALAFSQ